MIRLPPRPTLQYSVFPDTTLLRSVAIGFRLEVAWTIHLEPMASASWLWVLQHRAGVAVETSRSPCFVRPMDAAGGARAVLHPEIFGAVLDGIAGRHRADPCLSAGDGDRKSTRLNSSH